MIDILSASVELLSATGFTTARVTSHKRELILVEDLTVLAFLFAYDSPSILLTEWDADVSAAVELHQLALRRAGQKAWNTYGIFLTAGRPDAAQVAALSATEENLVGIRKIARAGVVDLTDLRGALLTLLPLQNAPRLESVDVQSEIRERATELPPPALDAFFSDADDADVIQTLEELA